MKAYGLRNKFFCNYTDCHPKRLGKGYANWWEVELGTVKSKKTARQEAKKVIQEELESY